jgi:hypothetical protein
MGKLIYKNPRTCYENGNSVTGKKIYELQAFCTCSDCQNRKSWKKEPTNIATATTKDISKVEEVSEFLKNWNCKDGKKWLETEYFKFPTE